jgi:hypothetical protein
MLEEHLISGCSSKYEERGPAVQASPSRFGPLCRRSPVLRRLVGYTLPRSHLRQVTAVSSVPSPSPPSTSSNSPSTSLCRLTSASTLAFQPTSSVPTMPMTTLVSLPEPSPRRLPYFPPDTRARRSTSSRRLLRSYVPQQARTAYLGYSPADDS